MSAKLSIKETIKNAIKEVVLQLDFEIEEGVKKELEEFFSLGKTVFVERPFDASHGDWSTNIALILASKLKMNPRKLAETVSSKLEEKLIIEFQTEGDAGGSEGLIKKIDIAGPGFINFTVAKGYYYQYIAAKLEEKDLQRSECAEINGVDGIRGKIVVEYGHPNTHKLPHIGHLYSYVVGGSLARILGNAGHEIVHVNYQGDVGPHVAKCIYGWRKLGANEPKELIDKVRHLQESYQLGSKDYDEDETAKAEIQKINRAIYTGDNAQVTADWQKTREWSLAYYLEFEKLLGVNQERHYLESEMWERGMQIVRENTPDIFKDSEGAIIFPGEEIGLHNRVFITQNNTATYETKELALNEKKLEEFNCDLTIIPTASEQNGYFSVVIEAINKSLPKLAGRIKHIGFGMVSLSTGKMSSRKGNILSAPDLVATVMDRIDTLLEGREGIDSAEKEQIVRQVALGAVKYAFLKGNVMQNMVFDLEESVAFDGNSGPYLQYTHARIQSIMQKSEKSEQINIDSKFLADNLTEVEEIKLIKTFERYAEIIDSAAYNLAPHLIATYLFELAQTFNQFYKQHSINGAPSLDIKHARLFLAEKTAQILKHGLGLLGIEAPTKM